jgi:hypothetical protein
LEELLKAIGQPQQGQQVIAHFGLAKYASESYRDRCHNGRHE